MKNERADVTRSELLGGAVLVALAIGAVALLYFLFPREARPPGTRSIEGDIDSEFNWCDVEREPAAQSAIALKQPNWMDAALDEWCVLDAASGAVVARVSQSWGPRNVPAGQYRVRVRQYASDGMDITLSQIIHVGEGELVRVVLCGGVKPEPAEWVPTPYQWGIVNQRGEYLQFASGRWDALLIPPGIFRLAIQQDPESARVVYARDVGVPGAGLVMVKIDSGIKPAPAEWAPTPRRWAVTSRLGEEIQHVAGTWETVVVPPGRYGLVIYPDSPEALPVRYLTRFEVEESELATVPIDSGITAEADSWVPIPYAWYVVDMTTGEDVQVCKGRWDHLLIPPGRYDIRIQPDAEGCVKMSYMRGVIVPPGKRVVVKVDTGIEIDPGESKEAPQWWAVLDSQHREIVQRVQGKWGKVVTPPGKYLIGMQPRGYNKKEVVFGPFDVRPGCLNKITLRGAARFAEPEKPAPKDRRNSKP
ncbi:MAG: hypothetical protein GXP25_09180 [Planctomycetes bacterium]|nr:hypothetical protein [Planctomycetota bacterium]